MRATRILLAFATCLVASAPLGVSCSLSLDHGLIDAHHDASHDGASGSGGSSVDGGGFGGTGGDSGGKGGDAGASGGDAGTAATGGGGSAGDSAVDSPSGASVICGITNPVVCTAAQQCCATEPGLDYCAPAGAVCQCQSGSCLIATITCDAPADCPQGSQCCAITGDAGTIDRVECQSSCGFNAAEVCVGDDAGSTCTGAMTCQPAAAWLPYIHVCL